MKDSMPKLITDDRQSSRYQRNSFRPLDNTKENPSFGDDPLIITRGTDFVDQQAN
jgi:hypothetical protein